MLKNSVIRFLNPDPEEPKINRSNYIRIHNTYKHTAVEDQWECYLASEVALTAHAPVILPQRLIVLDTNPPEHG